MTERSWLLLIFSVPARPDYLRVKVGRRLQRVGAVAVKPGVYALPASDETREDLGWISRDWLFSCSEGGALAAADWFSLIASCRLQRVDPWKYLYDVLGRLLDYPSQQVHELTPLNWRLAVEKGVIIPRSPVRPR